MSVRRCFREPLLLLCESMLSRQLSWSPSAPRQEESFQETPQPSHQAKVLQSRGTGGLKTLGQGKLRGRTHTPVKGSLRALLSQGHRRKSLSPYQSSSHVLSCVSCHHRSPEHSLSSIFLLLSVPGCAIPRSPLME